MNKKTHCKGNVLKNGVSFLFILLSTFMVVPGFAANHEGLLQQVKQKKVSINKKDVPVKDILDEIKRQTSFDFVINASFIADLGKRTLQVNDATVDEALVLLLQNTKYEYQVVNNHITFVLKKDAGEDAGKPKKMITVRGRVSDESYSPLPGVTILLEGTSLGTSTNGEGVYLLTIPWQDKIVLVYSFIGMKTERIEYGGKDTINVIMKEDIRAVEEVVVTGYGNVAKGNYTGASTTIKAEDIMMAGVSSIDQMLQGVVPGMLVWNTTGQVGATPKIRVRGTSSLLGSQEPLWVVDGIIQEDPQPFNSEDNMKFSVDADDIKNLAGNAISWLNPNDIETITVLKDASATAIYGSKAANGVIVITTKKAKPGKVSVSYAGSFSIGQRPRYALYDQMNSAEYMQFSKEMYEERRKYPTNMNVLPVGYYGLLQQLLNKEITREEMNVEYKRMARQNTDWFKILFRNSFNHSHSIGISGGSETIQSRVSFGFSQDKGEATGNDVTSFSVNSNTVVKPWKHLTVNMALKGAMREAAGFAYGVDPFNYAYKTSRVIPAYNEDGTLYYHPKIGETSNAIVGKSTYDYNILNELDNTGSENRTRTWGVTLDLRWRILSGLEYQGTFSYSSSSADVKQYATERSFYITQMRGYELGTVTPDVASKYSVLPSGGLLETSLTNVTSITTRNALVYTKLFHDKHWITLQTGVETNSSKTIGETNKRYGYMKNRGETFALPPVTYKNMGYGDSYMFDNTEIAQGEHSVLNRMENKFSLYASAVYTYDNRYVFNFSGRYDASNRFAQDKNKRYQPTWSVGVKWRLNEEHFLNELWWLNGLNVYGSYGYQGNVVSSVSPYLIAHDEYSEMYMDYVLKIRSLPYPNLGWEKTKTYNLGVDASFLKGRLSFVFNYFQKISEILSSRAVAYENGVANGVVSGSTMENYGYDFVINVVPVRTKDFSWQFSLNTAVTRNKVDKNKRVNRLTDYTSGACVVDGRPFSTFYSYEFGGLEQENGQPTFKNLDVENVADPTAFLVESGKSIADFSGGLNTMFKYKRISLYALFAVQWGGHKRLPDLYLSNSVEGIPGPEQNISRKLIHRWRNPGDITDIPALPVPDTGMTWIEIPATAVTASSGMRSYGMYNMSDVRVANTDFIRCRSLSLSYDFNEELLKYIGIQYLQVKASMTNPFMWVSDKKWDGLDPETGNWPARRVMSLSLQMMF